MDRRKFFKTGIVASAAALSCSSSQRNELNKATLDKLDKVLEGTVIQKENFKEPVFIKAVNLLRNGNHFIVEVIAANGATGYAISNNAHMVYLYPILVGRIAPLFVDKDARDLDELIEDVYVSNSNYKYQGLAFWVSLASVEFAVLDLLGKVTQKPVGELLGGVFNKEIAVYQANNYRGRTAEESVDLIRKAVEETNAKAAKYKIGGRMRKNADFPPGRTEKLIPLVRKVLGDELTIYADSNGSYDVENSIRIGRMLEDTNVSFFEEPCRFDHYDETKAVADILDIPIAGGEQESSMWAFRWLIANGAHQVVQPDVFYFGGMVRSIKVARMADVLGIPCTPHISGSGLGYLYMLNFVSAVKNAGSYHEYKGLNKEIPFDCPTSLLKPVDGVIKVPTSPGMGIELDRNFIQNAKKVEI